MPTPEYLRSNIDYTNLPLPQEARPDDLAEIRTYHKQGNSLARSVALTIMDQPYEGLAQYPLPDPSQKNDKNQEMERKAFQGLISWIYYRLPARAFLDAEGVVKNGEPEPIFEDSSNKPLVDHIMSTLGKKSFEPNEEQMLAGETNTYLKKLRLGELLKRTNSPLDVVNHATKLLTHELDFIARRTTDENIQLNILIAAAGCIHGKKHFRKLYEAAQEEGVL